MTRRLGLVAVAAVAAGVTLAGCGSSSSHPAASSHTATVSSSPAATASASSVTVDVRKTKLGNVLTNAAGYTLYWFKDDTATKVACTAKDSCDTIWPPLLGKVTTAPSGLSLNDFGTVTRPGGKVQVTYQGHPLYTYSGDHAPGQTNGEGYLGLWYVAKATSAAAPTSSSSPAGGGYGY